LTNSLKATELTGQTLQNGGIVSLPMEVLGVGLEISSSALLTLKGDKSYGNYLTDAVQTFASFGIPQFIDNKVINTVQNAITQTIISAQSYLMNKGIDTAQEELNKK
jgi:hypothetical protein